MSQVARSGCRRVAADWERSAAWALIVAAVAVLVTSSRRLASSPYGAEQVAFMISGGLGGLFMIVTASFLRLVADLRDQHRKVDRLASAMGGIPARRAEDVVRPAEVAGVLLALLGAGVAMGVGWRTAARTMALSRALEGLTQAAIALCGAVAVLLGLLWVMRLRVLTQMAATFEGLARRGAVHTPRPNEEIDVDKAPVWTAPSLERVHRRSCAALAYAPGAPFRIGRDSSLARCLLCCGGSDGA